MERRLTRRQTLKLAAAGSVPLLTGLRLPPAARAAGPVPGIVKDLPADLLIPRGTNAEMVWTAMSGQGYLTPYDRFFVRNHTRTPIVNPATWRLELFGTGLRGQPRRGAGVKLSLKDLERLERVTATVAVECAGNGRSYFATQQGTPAPGTAWTLGGIGVAEWKGVLLRDVLELAGVRGDAVDVMPEGLDDPVPAADGSSLGNVRRPFPIKKALDDVLIALEMNGKTLPFDHGFPARIVVPGWVGVANIKWVGSIRVANGHLSSPWNTTQYRMVGPTYPADAPPLTTRPLKSAFELTPGAPFKVGQPVVLTGRAWSGEARPRSVRVSTDGGRTWQGAKTYGANGDGAWLRWELPWTPTTAGTVALAAQATDRLGHQQPDVVPFNRDGYLFDGIVRLPVRVAA
ncbi:sulfite oxidase [Conexibacter woesei]|uniref:sulfite oxidase n=1 Tax=Conexibacter woesei TaxID=191495 RepID=UPI00041342EE|nr:sulfite oxidase [Conexibacter woesei]